MICCCNNRYRKVIADVLNLLFSQSKMLSNGFKKKTSGEFSKHYILLIQTALKFIEGLMPDYLKYFSRGIFTHNSFVYHPKNFFF